MRQALVGSIGGLGGENSGVAATDAHSQLIAQAAKEILGPLGIRRRGRSRTWVDDQGWWLGHIEFQPSSWSRGSYLNVGVMWLWDELPYLTYDVGYRVSSFEQYENDHQFQKAAHNLASRARNEAIRYRALFASPAGAASYYAGLGSLSPSDLPPAGIALGLVGRTAEARDRFDAYLAVEDDREWAIAKKQRIHELRRVLEDPPTFLRRVRASIATTRELLGVPPLVDRPF